MSEVGMPELTLEAEKLQLMARSRVSAFRHAKEVAWRLVNGLKGQVLEGIVFMDL